jgi:RecA-family ATPase
MNDTKEKAVLDSAAATAEEQPLSSNDNSIITKSHYGDNINQVVSSSCQSALETFTVSELLDMSFKPKIPVVDGIINPGTYIFAGAPKVGKSFLMLQFAYHIAKGIPLWNYPVRQGSVLYLALEDDYSRLQQRVARMFGEEGNENLHLATKSKTIKDGLIEEMTNFAQKYIDARLIIIDTLKRVREYDDAPISYASDYDIMKPLKDFSDQTGISIIIVHHTRKMAADDICETISGTNGLFGAVDGALILHKSKRTDTEAILNVIGRDQQELELTLEMESETCIWNKVKSETELFPVKPDPILVEISQFITIENPCWEGTASELIEAVPNIQYLIKPNTLVRKLNIHRSGLYKDFGILYEPLQRSSERKIFRLSLTFDDSSNPSYD